MDDSQREGLVYSLVFLLRIGIQLKCPLAFQTRLYRFLSIFCVEYRCIAVQFMIMVRDSVEADITLIGQYVL